MDIFTALAQQWPPWLAALLLGSGWLLHGTGIVGHLFGARQLRLQAAIHEAEQETVDWRAFTAVLTTELDEVRVRHRNDIADFVRRLDDLHEELADERKNSMRWRHLVSSMGTHIVIQRRLMERNGLEAPRFDWSGFIADGGDPSKFEGIV